MAHDKEKGKSSLPPSDCGLALRRPEERQREAGAGRSVFQVVVRQCWEPEVDNGVGGDRAVCGGISFVC